MYIISRKEGIDPGDIERGEDIDPFLENLQLGGGGVDVYHSGCVGFVLAEW